MRRISLCIGVALISAAGATASAEQARQKPSTALDAATVQAVKVLKGRVADLEKAVAELRHHKHEMPYGVGNFYVYGSPNDNQRIALSMPFFTPGTPDRGLTKAPQYDQPKAVHTSRPQRKPAATPAPAAGSAASVKVLEERVRSLGRTIAALRKHTHELPYGYANFWVYGSPQDNQRIGLNIPIFTPGTPNRRLTSPPMLDEPKK